VVKLFFALLLLGVALPSFAQQMHAGAHFQDHEEFRKVLDLRCTICHTQERIDEAISEERDMLGIQERMVERGAQLSERDHSVLSHFWGDPLKERRRPNGQ
jgi:uncharacterized membrane protein